MMQRSTMHGRSFEARKQSIFLTGQDHYTLLNINGVGSLQQLTFQGEKKKRKTLENGELIAENHNGEGNDGAPASTVRSNN